MTFYPLDYMLTFLNKRNKVYLIRVNSPDTFRLGSIQPLIRSSTFAILSYILQYSTASFISFTGQKLAVLVLKFLNDSCIISLKYCEWRSRSRIEAFIFQKFLVSPVFCEINCKRGTLSSFMMSNCSFLSDIKVNYLSAREFTCFSELPRSKESNMLLAWSNL